MTPTDICNIALARLGEARIMALTDTSKPARACSMLYPQSRDTLLRMHPWVFAKDRAKLSRFAEGPEFGWEYAFSLPTTCLRVLTLNGETEEESAEFEIEKGRLLTDESEARITFVTKFEDSTKFDSLFTEALSVLIASKLAVTLTGSSTRAADLRTEFERLIKPAAIKTNSSESNPRNNYMRSISQASHFIAARSAGIDIPRTTP